MRSFRRLISTRKHPPPVELPVLSFSDSHLDLSGSGTPVDFANSARLLDESSSAASSSTTVVDEEDSAEQLHDAIVEMTNPHLNRKLAAVGPYVCIGHLRDYKHVVIAKHQERDEYVAIKQQEISSPRADEVEYKTIHEMTISQMLSDAQFARIPGHKHIVSFVGHVSCFDTNVHLLVTQYCRAGNLFDFLNGLGRRMSTRQRIGLMRDFTNGMQYIHSMNVAHRDLKHENMFLEYDRDEKRYIVKIGDFGSSTMASADASFFIKPGSPYYAAPELLSYGVYSPLPADVWAYGVAVYVLFEMDYPFEISVPGTNAVAEHAVETIIVRLDKVKFRDQAVQKLIGPLISTIFRYKPTARPVMKKIAINHIFVGHPAPITRDDFAMFAAYKK